jgi:hypothetical protein
VVVAAPSASYFSEMAKPMPPRQGELEFYDYVLRLSDGWDNLYRDRREAWREIGEATR